MIAGATQPIAPWILLLARSTDEGRTFRNYLLSENSYDTMDNEIGEYTALAAFGGRIYGSWMEVVSPPAQGSYGPHAASVIRLGMADFSGQ